MGCISSSLKDEKNTMVTKKNFDPKSFKFLDYRVLTTAYTITPKVLGAGNFGKVFLAKSIANPDFKVAIKTLNKKKIGDNLDKIKEEIHIVSKLDHPNICKYYETYESPKHVYLIMEYCEGIDLFEKITAKEVRLTEQKIAFVMK
jgi:serine/threonine protein kinase